MSTQSAATVAILTSNTQSQIPVQRMSRLAASSWNLLVEAFPELEPLPQDRSLREWNFFMTVAAVGSSLIAQREWPGRATSTAEPPATARDLGAWHPSALDTLLDFLARVARSVDDGFDLPTATGLWVLCKVKRSFPEPEELPMAPAIGGVLFKSLELLDLDRAGCPAIA